MAKHLRVIGAMAFAVAALAAVPAHADLIEGLYLFPDLGSVADNLGTQSTTFPPGFSFSLNENEDTLAETGHNTVCLLYTSRNQRCILYLHFSCRL